MTSKKNTISLVNHSGGGNLGLGPVRVLCPGDKESGYYIWIGTDSNCLTYIENIKLIKKLGRFCKQVEDSHASRKK